MEGIQVSLTVEYASRYASTTAVGAATGRLPLKSETAVLSMFIILMVHQYVISAIAELTRASTRVTFIKLTFFLVASVVDSRLLELCKRIIRF